MVAIRRSNGLKRIPRFAKVKDLGSSRHGPLGPRYSTVVVPDENLGHKFRAHRVLGLSYLNPENADSINRECAIPQISRRLALFAMRSVASELTIMRKS